MSASHAPGERPASSPSARTAPSALGGRRWIVEWVVCLFPTKREKADTHGPKLSRDRSTSWAGRGRRRSERDISPRPSRAKGPTPPTPHSTRLSLKERRSARGLGCPPSCLHNTRSLTHLTHHQTHKTRWDSTLTTLERYALPSPSLVPKGSPHWARPSSEFGPRFDSNLSLARALGGLTRLGLGLVQSIGCRCDRW